MNRPDAVRILTAVTIASRTRGGPYATSRPNVGVDGVDAIVGGAVPIVGGAVRR